MRIKHKGLMAKDYTVKTVAEFMEEKVIPLPYGGGGAIERLEEQVSNISSELGKLVELLMDKGVISQKDFKEKFAKYDKIKFGERKRR